MSLFATTGWIDPLKIRGSYSRGRSSTDDSSRRRWRASAPPERPVPGAAADDRNFVFGGEFHALRDVLGGCGKNDDFGKAFFDGAVVFVEKEIFQLVKNGVFAKKLGQLMKEAGIMGRAIVGAPGTIVRDGERAQRQDRPGARGLLV